MKGLGRLCLVGLVAVLVPAWTCANNPPADRVQAEMKKLVGTWQLVSAEKDGKQMPAEQAKQIRVVISEKTHTVYFGKHTVVERVQFHIDPTKTPKWTQDTLKDGRTIRGIYEVKGDTLRSCVAEIDKPRPKTFTGAAGSGCTLRVFKRVRNGSQAKGK